MDDRPVTQQFEEMLERGALDEPPARQRRFPKVALVIALLAVIVPLGIVVGSSALTGVANVFGLEIDAKHCVLYRPTSCSSVSLSEINRVSQAELPESSDVTESFWQGGLKGGYLSALVQVTDATWTPPADTYELCTSTGNCTGEVPLPFERNDISVTAEYAETEPLGIELERRVVVGQGADGTTWVAVTVSRFVG